MYSNQKSLMAAQNCDNSGKNLYKMKNFDETTFDIVSGVTVL